MKSRPSGSSAENVSRSETEKTDFASRVRFAGTSSRRFVATVAAGKDLQTMPHKRRV